MMALHEEQMEIVILAKSSESSFIDLVDPV